MENRPALAARIAPLRTSVFAVLAKRMEGYEGKRYPFHIGDNALRPPDAAIYGSADASYFGDPYRYGYPGGELGLREAIAKRGRRVHGHVNASADNVQVTVGATHAVSCAIQALIDPGQEILLLAPYWPLVRGISYCAGVIPVDVPFYQHLLDCPETYDGPDCADAIASLIEPFVNENTRAIYIISPNNPNGIVLSAYQSLAIANIAKKYDLWVIDDRAYESYVYHQSATAIASLPNMSGRTVSTYTFSKTFAMAGTRIGYAIASERVIGAMRRVATHSVYNPAQICQSSAWAALQGADAFLATAVESYRQRAQLVSTRLTSVPFHPAQGGSFVFIDLSANGPSAMPVLERAADRGVTLAPGAIFGMGFDAFARLCFTAAPMDDLAEGLDILNEVVRTH